MTIALAFCIFRSISHMTRHSKITALKSNLLKNTSISFLFLSQPNILRFFNIEPCSVRMALYTAVTISFCISWESNSWNCTILICLRYRISLAVIHPQNAVISSPPAESFFSLFPLFMDNLILFPGCFESILSISSHPLMLSLLILTSSFEF